MNKETLEKTLELIDIVIDKTKSNKCNWTLIGKDHFALSFKSYELNLKYKNDDLELTIINYGGNTILTIDQDDLCDEDYTKLIKLYYLIPFNKKTKEEVLSDMLNELRETEK